VNSNQRAIRLAISGLLIVFGLVSLSQAGFYVIRYFALDNALDSNEIFNFMLSFWRGYWVIVLAFLIHFSIKSIKTSNVWRVLLLVSAGLTAYSFV
jgi:hypothetical protein